jgi:hypothetical protein
MSPPAAGAAGRTKRPKSTGKRAAKPPRSSSRSSGRVSARHSARTVRRSPAPRTARRVSGPVGGRAAAAAAALPRPQLAPLGPRLVAFASTLPDRGFVDRMVRGRTWIAVLGILLIGLVATQVSLLKLNSGIGRAVERSAAVERANGVLRAQVSQLESGERIQEQAAALGMVMPPAGQISYVRGGGAAGAARALDDGRFNDPTQSIALPGTQEPPDPLSAALSGEDDVTSPDEQGVTDGDEEEVAAEDGDEESGAATGEEGEDGEESSSGDSDTTGSSGDETATATGGSGAPEE